MKRMMTITILALLIILPATSNASTKGTKKGTDHGKAYTNKDGKHKKGPSTDKANATHKCGDGTKSESDHDKGACSGHGGTAK
jgi:hypothetical protein